MASSFDTEMETPEMETLSSLAENLVYLLPGCADLMIRKTIQEVYRDFCRRSCCLCGRRHFVLESDGSLFVAPMFGGVIDCIVEVKYNRHLLGKRDYVVTGSRIMFRDSLVPPEDLDEESLPKIDVMFIEMPKMNSEEVPSWFIQRHGEDICCGVLSRLMAMTGKAWSDAQQAGDNRLRYENAVCETRLRHYARNDDGEVGSGENPDGLI